MSDLMAPYSFSSLLHWIFDELKKHNSIFAIPQNFFYKSNTKSHTTIFGELLDNPVGVAAGPHTQMAQNIITSYLTGARFIELKTVQVLDSIEIEKPCIDANDEGYNVEWSQELDVEQSFDEYLKSWLLIHLLKEYLSIQQNGRGFVFNMSVGYDLDGIKSNKVDKFIEMMRNSSLSKNFDKYLDILKNYLTNENPIDWDEKKIDSFIDGISSALSNSVTLSTMHGCPFDEIESIVEHLVMEKGLHTYVKLNPTLLGFDRVKEILRNTGYEYIDLDRASFDNDLQMEDAIPMLNHLDKFSKKHNKNLGLKLSNTLGVKNFKESLPGTDMYMSGRTLFPLTINLAALLTNKLEGRIPISFSGGASALNTNQILQTGIYPVTLVTELLKPGGYFRLKYIAENLDVSIPNKLNVQKLNELAEESLQTEFYHKSFRDIDKIKLDRTLPKFDCYLAPCQIACPIGQDVPQYIQLIENGKYEEAFDLITTKNPLPHITGYICDHQCEFYCTRWDYDQPLNIRELKRVAAENGYRRNDLDIKGIQNNAPVAVIGAGPSGLSAAYFLAKKGFPVTVFEKEAKAGGVVQNVIPNFRLPDSAIQNDVEFIKSFGVKFEFNSSPDLTIKDLRNDGFKYFYISIGAELPKQLSLKDGNDKVFNAVEFLRDLRKGKEYDLGRKVTVIGGGNSAMDGARAAVRSEGVEEVTILYRRTKEFMPADKEEYEAALNDGVKFKELLLPVEYKDNSLKCQVMQLGEKDSDGRRKVIPVENSFEEFHADSIISAIGEEIDKNYLRKFGLPNDVRQVKINPEFNKTSLANVFMGGDALRGPATVVEAIADAQKAVNGILRKEGIQKNAEEQEKPEQFQVAEYTSRKGKIDFKHTTSYIKEASRCLGCDTICNKCVDVCPNRANIPITMNGGFKDTYQILHVDDLCNECGNCETFCPYTAAPYKEKFTLFGSYETFINSENEGFVFLKETNKGGLEIMVRADGMTSSLRYFPKDNKFESNDDDLGEDLNHGNLKSLIAKVHKDYNFLVK